MIAALSRWLQAFPSRSALSAQDDIAAVKDRNAQIAARLKLLEAELLRDRPEEVRDARV